MNNGFTLIETLIVVAILGTLTAMFLGYNQIHTGQLSLYIDRAQVTGILQRAKSLALEKYVENSSFTCAFGVHWEANSREYFIYEVSSSTSPCANYNYQVNSPNYKKVQTFYLNAKNIFTKEGNAYFVPPYFTTSASSTVEIENIDTKKSVQINVSGNSICSP